MASVTSHRTHHRISSRSSTIRGSTSRKVSRQSSSSDDSPECDDREEDDDGRFPNHHSAHSRASSSSKPPVSYVDYHSTRYQAGYDNSTTSPEPVSKKRSLSSVKDLLRRTSERPGSTKGKEKDLRHEAKQRPIYTDLRVFNTDSVPFGSGEITPTPLRHERSSTGPSVSSHDWSEPTTYSFRDSVSSSLSQFETPPHTPIDDIIRGSMDRISVVAPVSGVEAMDALVDGMNGFGVDDRYLSKHSWSARPSKTERAGAHPLYQPPLPSPPPGIKLGGALPRGQSDNSTDDDVDDTYGSKGSRSRPSNDTRKPQRPKSSPSTPTFALQPTPPPVRQKTADIDFPRVNPTIDEIIHKYSSAKTKSPTPSVSGAIRSHNAAVSSVRTSKSKNRASAPVKEPDSSPGDASEDTEMVSRSSVDSVTAEAMTTARTQQVTLNQRQPLLQHAHSFANNRASVYSDHTIDLTGRSPRSETGHEPSIYSFSVHSEPAYEFLSLPPSSKQPAASQAIAQYLHSKRLTTLLKLTRWPHASMEHPLTVSLSDLGCPTGFPLVVFLGLGCVRHVMGVYDEMAECLGLRLIAIDRWGLGRTQTPHSRSARGIPEWATVVNEVLDQLGIGQCSIMAHSAGSPYALAFANRYPHRVRGDICLLAPWVGEGAGYKWLKYVPNGLLKTAQAAEWKVQAWMLGKPPTIAYEGIGFDLQKEREEMNGQNPLDTTPSTPESPSQTDTCDQHLLISPVDSRPSISSSVFSEYDDLRDFEGRFESQSTVVGHPSRPLEKPQATPDNKSTKKKGSKSFLGKFKGGHSQPQPPSPAPEKNMPSAPKRLKALRSMSSLRNKANASSRGSSTTMKPPTPSPRLPQTLSIDTTIEFGIENWTSRTPSPGKRGTDSSPEPPPSSFKRVEGVRSISLGTTNSRSPYSYYPPSPPSSSLPTTPTTETGTGASYEASLANALIAASHAESAKGTHNDLLLILNHDRVPWGFSYQYYPHTVAVWYGDKDERIAESAVRWLEQTMGKERCQVNVVKGADHGLMYNTTVVLEVFDKVHEYAKQWKRTSPSPSVGPGT